jgi:hypothetical protein
VPTPDLTGPDHFHQTPVIKTPVKFQRSPLEFRWTFQNVIFKTQQIKVRQKSTGHPLDLHQKFVEIIWIALITFENNVWISSFQSILKWMIISNFKWYLHIFLYMHTKPVIQR